MRRYFFSLPTLFLMGATTFVFVRVFQHNLIIKLNYEYQRLEKKRLVLEKERNDLLSRTLLLRDYDRLMTKAEEKWGMQPLHVTQVKRLELQQTVDVMHTTSSDRVLRQLGLYEVAYGCTGDRHAHA